MDFFVISNFDLVKFGCPYCGSLDGSTFIINGTCSIWGCHSCNKECAIVGRDLKEVHQFNIIDTKLVDFIGNHPFQTIDCQINTFSSRVDCLASG